MDQEYATDGDQVAKCGDESEKDDVERIKIFEPSIERYIIEQSQDIRYVKDDQNSDENFGLRLEGRAILLLECRKFVHLAYQK